ncbi:MAG: WYL domain-containing protein [Paludibacteraceae bacterium]|nr:WYL domain-containing protein [Paludibacteraceae bacterium]
MAAHQVNVYLWLMDAIASGHLTRKDIDRRWSRCRYNDDHEDEFPERRFHRYRHELEEIFDIEIRCNRARGGVYYIENKEDIGGDLGRKWLLNAMSVHSMLDQAKDISENILYEDIPQGTQYLTTIVDAIRTRTQLLVTYHNYERNETYDFMLAPYCLKAFKQRWYVAGCPSTHPNEKRVYALDRIQNIEYTESNFKYPKDFNAQDFFAPYYGVFRNEQPTKVVIEANSKSTQFLRLLPLHPSQKEVQTIGDKTIFEYFIAPTFDFIQELRTHGSDIRIIAPDVLVNKFKEEAQKAYLMYCQQEESTK